MEKNQRSVDKTAETQEIIKLQLFIDCDRIRKLILACFINAMETDTERY